MKSEQFFDANDSISILLEDLLEEKWQFLRYAFYVTALTCITMLSILVFLR